MPRISNATKAEHRRRLLDAAAREFAVKGIAGARVDDISLAAGLAKGTIYNYFDSKEDIFRAVVEAWAQRTAERHGNQMPHLPIREQLLAFVRADMEVVAEGEDFARAALRELLVQPQDVVTTLLPAWDPVDDQLKAIITAGITKGELRDDRDAEDLTRLLLTMVNGLLFEHWVLGGPTLADIPDLVVDYYLDGASARRPT